MSASRYSGIEHHVGNTPLLRLKRLPINDADDPALLTAKLDGAYDWLALPQRMVKAIKSLRKRTAFSPMAKAS